MPVATNSLRPSPRKRGPIATGGNGLARLVITAIFCLLRLARTRAGRVSFRGKTVRMIVGSVPGGVTDVGARHGRALHRQISAADSPTVVVQNMPAANGIAAANYFYQQVAPDGLTFLAGSSSQVTPDVIRSKAAVRYDPTQIRLHRRGAERRHAADRRASRAKDRSLQRFRRARHHGAGRRRPHGGADRRFGAPNISAGTCAG